MLWADRVHRDDGVQLACVVVVNAMGCAEGVDAEIMPPKSRRPQGYNKFAGRALADPVELSGATRVPGRVHETDRRGSVNVE